MSDLTISELQSANYRRNKEWDPQEKLTGLFFATELAGEVGEACNVVKKLYRESLDIPGSRATDTQLGEELADVIIVACLLANYFDLNLDQIIRDKFNATSDKIGFKVFL